MVHTHIPATDYAQAARAITTLGQDARSIRAEAGLSLRDAAQDMGVAFSTLHRIEQGREANGSSLQAVMRWVDAMRTMG